MDPIELHRTTPVVDCHNDLLLTVARARATGDTDLFARYWIPQLRAGGVDVQVVPVYVEEEFEPEGALRRTLTLIEYLMREVENHPEEVVFCRSGDDIDSALSSGKIAMILSLEGCDGLAPGVELFPTMHRLGVRMASLVHFGRSHFADGSAEEETGSRLTRSGVAAIGEMQRLGILVDVSHLSAPGLDHVLELATRPIVASHSSARAECQHHRNLSDEHLRGIASTGGVAGVNLYPAFIDATEPTMNRVIDHLEHMVDVAGAEHVGLGPDFIQEFVQDKYGHVPDLKIEGLPLHWSIPDLERTEHLPNLTVRMIERGWAQDDVVAVLGRNFLRVFREVMRD